MNALHSLREISAILTNVPSATRMLAVIMGIVFAWRDGLVMDRHAHPKEAHQEVEAYQELALLVLLHLARYQIALQVAKVATALLVHTVLRVVRDDLHPMSFKRLAMGVCEGKCLVLSLSMAFAT